MWSSRWQRNHIKCSGKIKCCYINHTAAKILQYVYETSMHESDTEIEKQRLLLTAVALIRSEIIDKYKSLTKEFYPDAQELKSVDKMLRFLSQVTETFSVWAICGDIERPQNGNDRPVPRSGCQTTGTNDSFTVRTGSSTASSLWFKVLNQHTARSWPMFVLHRGGKLRSMCGRPNAYHCRYQFWIWFCGFSYARHWSFCGNLFAIMLT